MKTRPDLERHFKALADASRLRIVNLLLHTELCGCDMEGVLQISQSNVSRHLTYLRHAGLVTHRREGYRIYYRLAERRARVLDELLEFLRAAFKNDQIFRDDRRRLEKAIKNGACASEPRTSKIAVAKAESQTQAQPRGG